MLQRNFFVVIFMRRKFLINFVPTYIKTCNNSISVSRIDYLYRTVKILVTNYWSMFIQKISFSLSHIKIDQDGNSNTHKQNGYLKHHSYSFLKKILLNITYFG